jgi:hypothetical protein
METFKQFLESIDNNMTQKTEDTKINTSPGKNNQNAGYYGKRVNKTQQARDILANSHNIKKAKMRKDGKYLLNHKQVKNIMAKMGLMFNPKKGKWLVGMEKPAQQPKQQDNAQSKPDKEEKLNQIVQNRDSTLPTEDEFDELIEVPDEFDSVNELKDEEFEDDYVKGKDGETFRITEKEVMIFQARFLLSLIWEEFSFTRYELKPDGKIWGDQSRSDTLHAAKLLNIMWDALDDTWHTETGRQVYRLKINHNETKKSIVGRALLANMNFLEYIQFDERLKLPKRTPDSVKSLLEKYDFYWDDSEEIWEYLGEDHRADYGNISRSEEK